MTTAAPARRAGLDLMWVQNVLACVLIASPAIVKVIFYPDYPGSDDAFIHVATAEHILSGQGWGIAGSGHVNLSSSPAFTVILLAVLSVGSIGLAQATSLVFACAGLAVTYLAVRRLTSRSAGLVALAVAAANVHLWRWSGTVMETSLGYLAVACIAAWALTRCLATHRTHLDLAVLGVLIGIGTMVRFEIGLLLPISLAIVWLAGERRLTAFVTLLVSFIVGVGPWLIFSSLYFGSPIPTTFYAKASSLHIVNVQIVKQIGSVVASGFGVSILLAVAFGFLAFRSAAGRAMIRSSLLPLLFCTAWPIALFAFYYLKTSGLQSAARYFLPGMATWPFIVGLLALAASRNVLYRAISLAGATGCVIVALCINAIQITPVLERFNSGYRVAMSEGASYLQSHCSVGDTALISVDIGIMARNGVGECAPKDGGALATPELRNMTLSEQVSFLGPKFIVQSIGSERDALASRLPGYKLVYWRAYPDHGVARGGKTDYLNIYQRYR